MSVRVLLVEDFSEVRLLLRLPLRLRSEVEIVGEAATSAEAARLAAERRPDLVVLDLGLPDSQGHDTYRRVHAAAPDSRIVIYTADDRDPGWYEQQGAAFVGKDADLDSLLAAIAAD